MIFFSDHFDNNINPIVSQKIHYCKMSEKHVTNTQICGQRFLRIGSTKNQCFSKCYLMVKFPLFFDKKAAL